MRDPEWCRQWIRPSPGTVAPFRLSYMGAGQYCFPISTSLDVGEVADCLRRMQRVLPLGGIGDYEILCLDHQLCWEPPTDGTILGQRFPGWIALSGRSSIDLYDLITHEVSHELDERFLTDADRRTFFAVLGQAFTKPTDQTPWHERPQERMAEYVSSALWGVPIRDPHMIQLTQWQLEYVRMWALGKFGGRPVAEVLVPSLETVIEVHALTGETWLNGQPYTWQIPPVNVGGRLMFSGREWTDLVRGETDYNPETYRARFTFRRY